MKVYEKYMAACQQEFIETFQNKFKEFALTGICSGVPCRFCPFLDDARPCRDISYEERMKLLNKEEE